jgi:hypothetical protein
VVNPQNVVTTNVVITKTWSPLQVTTKRSPQNVVNSKRGQHKTGHPNVVNSNVVTIKTVTPKRGQLQKKRGHH